MNSVNIERFDEFFEALHGHPPYPWQRALAQRAVAGAWPRVIDLPTGSGKTACIDIAVFALACQAEWTADQQSAPRRIFFCVNRRVIVDEAFDRARRIAAALRDAERRAVASPTILRDVAAALRITAGTTPDDRSPPLDVLELRGGIYRDNRWARSLMQPTVICTTVDQLGSRLLFRGYGVSPNAAPIQAALIAYDSLILLDEAHISRPFLESLDYVRGFVNPEKWAETGLNIRPAIAVPMTATPPTDVRDDEVVRLGDDDRAALSLQRRLVASKPARLTEVTDIVRDATRIARDESHDAPRAIGIIVNRVNTARQIYAAIRDAQQSNAPRKSKIDSGVHVELVIGSMRPLDRDKQAKRLRELVGPNRPAITEQTSIVVSTQCLEVGADYDFDTLITECAALDALRQRFGRLNRAGREIDARAHILINKKQSKPESKLSDDKPDDPIYGNALAHTWNWLCEHATQPGDSDTDPVTIDFGIDAFQALLAEQGEDQRAPAKLLSPSAHQRAPVMLPAYLDLWCQTSPRPEPDPDVALFIHGPQRTVPDVQVCWRADLVDSDDISPDELCDTAALLPPTAAECMTVPIYRLRQWLSHSESSSDGDLLGEPEPEDAQPRSRGPRRPPKLPRAVLWRGADRSAILQDPDDLRPGDTLVLPISAGGWDDLGHVPGTVDTDSTALDLAEDAFTQARNLAALRLHPALRSRLPSTTASDELAARATDTNNPPTKGEWRDLLAAAAKALEDGSPLRRTLTTLAAPNTGLVVEPYPQGRGVVLTSRRWPATDDLWSLRALDDGEDQPSRTLRDKPIPLSTHTRHVLTELNHALDRLPLDDLRPALRLAAALHDTGKADERFQALLRRTDRTDAWLWAGATPEILAKSAAIPLSPHQRDAARHRAGLPRGFRHEMLAVQLAKQWPGLTALAAHRDLALHLIAAHHGYARPFAPVVVDPDPPDVELTAPVALHEADPPPDSPLAITADERRQAPPHRLDSGIAERFWRLTRCFGWWGLAYLEAVLRLADQQASAAEEAGKYGEADEFEPAEVTA